MKVCPDCKRPVIMHVETRRWEGVLLAGIEVYRCENGHDHLVIPNVQNLVELRKTSKSEAFMYDDGLSQDSKEGWFEYATGRFLVGDVLYVIEERELPDGDWVCDSEIFDTEEKARAAADPLEDDGTGPATETRVVAYQRLGIVPATKA